MPTNLKRKRIKLSNGSYRKLAAEVLKRDAKTCQHCGCYTESPPHHVVYRSQGGDDSLGNLKTYCIRCHRAIHDGKINFKRAADFEAV
jgi:5-methylcytosine-specific restriction endonuclease McrA